ncbi:MAG TPA: response regulator transcription factor [Saprospiraceae bacterium]|nr:response regulator transcription factor [Saprospiraceae bacterium]HMU04008.1 response regulator transcription factor [Saprospiraceae bacterium]
MMNILVVEDEPGIHKFLKQGLEEEGYVVDIADDGNQGLALAVSKSYQIVLLDWMLPGMSGLEICKQLRARQIDTPIIFLTAKDTIQETIAGLQAGANDYIKKPFSFEELLERIKVQLRNVKVSTDSIIIDNIKIVISSHQVFKGEVEIHLTQKEFELLVFLISNKGKVCTRKEIIEQVWDIHFDYDTGVIDVFVNGIRKKLDLDKETGFLQTIRGIGYLVR